GAARLHPDHGALHAVDDAGVVAGRDDDLGAGALGADVHDAGVDRTGGAAGDRASRRLVAALLGDRLGPARPARLGRLDRLGLLPGRRLRALVAVVLRNLRAATGSEETSSRDRGNPEDLHTQHAADDNTTICGMPLWRDTGSRRWPGRSW